MLHAGSGPIGELPAASLPIVAAVLAGLYEMDNTPEPADKKQSGGGARIATKARVAEEEEEEDDGAAAPAAKKRTR
jgi:hypothetical protein